MRIRSIVIAAALAAVAFLPATSQAAAGVVYKAKGSLTVIPRSNESPGYWSISGTLQLVRGVGKAPKSGNFTASGALGPLSASNARSLTINPSGVMKITWSDASITKAVVVYFMANRIHIVTGVINSGFGKYGVVVYPWLAASGDKNDVSGNLTLLAGGTVDKILP